LVSCPKYVFKSRAAPPPVEASPAAEPGKFQVASPAPRQRKTKGVVDPVPEEPTPPSPGELEELIRKRKELTSQIRNLRHPKKKVDPYELYKPKLLHALEANSVNVFYSNKREKREPGDFTASEAKRLKAAGILVKTARSVTITRQALWLSDDAISKLKEGKEIPAEAKSQ